MCGKNKNKTRKETLRRMAERIKRIRELLVEKLVAMGTPVSWQHITHQRGMFAYSGLSGECGSWGGSEGGVGRGRGGRGGREGWEEGGVGGVGGGRGGRDGGEGLYK